MTKQELERELEKTKSELLAYKTWRKKDRDDIITFKAENEAYKKQISFYERIIEQLLDKTEY